MSIPSHLIRIFWPSDANRSGQQGVAVGWRNSSLDVFVVCVLEHVEARNVESAIRAGILFRNCPHPIQKLLDICGNPDLHVVGVVDGHVKPTNFEPSSLNFYTSPTSRMPLLFCPSTCGISAQIVVYEKPVPKQMQYLSLGPIPLALKVRRSAIDTKLESYKQGHYLPQKLRLHTILSPRSSQMDLSLSLVLQQINCAKEMSDIMQQNANYIGAKLRRKISVGERVAESASNAWSYLIELVWHFLMTYLWPIITRTFKSGLFCHRVAAELLLLLLEWQPRTDSASLRDISATAQQVDIRLQQFCYWPIQYTTLRKRREDWYSITDSHPDYIRFYNSLWLVANDVIIGIALGSFILDNADWVANRLDMVVSGWTLDNLSGMIVWLTDVPAGLKLNNELASFLGDLFLWVMDYWSHCVGRLEPFLSHLIFFIGFSSFAGASMPIALFSDLLSLLTIHIYSFYVASARIYHWQLTIIISLFHLFRGKKHNVLRNRIDSCDYDLDQLLLGTILFTLLVFLLPTVIVFYFTFAFARVVIIALKASLDTMLAFLNHFPLFALMLKIKDPGRLPGGVCFELREAPGLSSRVLNSDQLSPTSYVILKPMSLSLASMLQSYFELGQRLRDHYLSIRVLFALVTGQFVPPMHRKTLYSLQYSMLPARRHTINEMWNLLNERRFISNSLSQTPRLVNVSLNRRAR